MIGPYCGRLWLVCITIRWYILWSYCGTKTTVCMYDRTTGGSIQKGYIHLGLTSNQSQTGKLTAHGIVTLTVDCHIPLSVI